MNESNSRPTPAHQHLIASVLLAEIAGYADRPVFEQIDLTSRCRLLFELGIAQTPCEGLVSIDRENSIVLLFPGDPTDCLRFANWLENILENDPRLNNLPLRVGVNLGAVTLSRNERSEFQISGAGADDALRVAQSGRFREVLISRSFYTVLSRTSMNDRLLRHKAFISDEHDQSFAVYQIARPETPAMTAEPSTQPSSLPIAPRVHPSRARWSAVAAAALVVAGGLTIFDGQTQETIQQVEALKISTKPIVAMAPKPALPGAAIIVTEPDPTFVPDPELSAPPAAVATAADQLVTPVAIKSANELRPKVAAVSNVTVQLSIKPWGEVYVDGKKVGVTPPLSKIKVLPGKRAIVVRNADFVPFQTTLDVQPESLLQVSHRFDK